MKKANLIFILFLLHFYFSSVVLSRPFPKTKPEDVGMSSQCIQRIVPTIKKWVVQKRIAGAIILIIRHNKIVVHEAVGWSDINKKIPLQINHICRLGSNTKPFIGSCILMLMEEGKLQLEDRVSKYIPSFRNDKSKHITIFQLMTHTSGFALDDFVEEYKKYHSLGEAVDSLAIIGPKFKPGSKFKYSSEGASVLGVIVEKISGMKSEDYIEQRIFKPLEMDDSFCYLEEGEEKKYRLPSRYKSRSGKLEEYWNNTQPEYVSFFTASTNAYSTALDYAKFMSMWLKNGKYGNHRLLSPSTVKLAIKPHAAYVHEINELIKNGGPYEYNRIYGLQWWVYSDKHGAMRTPLSPGSFANFGKHGTYAVADPERDLIAIYFTQTAYASGTWRPFINMVLSAIIK